MNALYEDLTDRMAAFDSSSSKQEQEDVLEKLKETHATSAGLKAFCTVRSDLYKSFIIRLFACKADVICCLLFVMMYSGAAWKLSRSADKLAEVMDIRLMLAYLACMLIRLSSVRGKVMYVYSGTIVSYDGLLRDIYLIVQADACPATLQNTILTLQSGRSLIGSYLEAKAGKKVADGVSYLNDLARRLKAKCPSDDVATDMAVMDDAWGCVAANVIHKAAQDYTKHVKAGKSKDVAHELCSQERFIAAKVCVAARRSLSCQWLCIMNFKTKHPHLPRSTDSYDWLYLPQLPVGY